MKERYNQGLIFKKLDVRGKVFIKYIPVENVWSPIILMEMEAAIKMPEDKLEEQNGFKDRYNVIKVKTLIDNNDVRRVLFGGGAIVRIEGKYNL